MQDPQLPSPELLTASHNSQLELTLFVFIVISMQPNPLDYMTASLSAGMHANDFSSIMGPVAFTLGLFSVMLLPSKVMELLLTPSGKFWSFENAAFSFVGRGCQGGVVTV